MTQAQAQAQAQVRVTRHARRIAASPDAPAIAAAVLGPLAAVEISVRTGSTHTTLTLALLLALSTAAPLALLRYHRPTAAVLITFACVTSLALQALTAAGSVAQLAVLPLLGRTGHPRLATLCALPYAITAVAGPQSDAIRVHAIVLACLASAATAAGIAGRARADAQVRDATERAIAETFLEHAARGERARIARELHDVVAHHISMISVQAETARLTTPGMPEAGAKRLTAIGDTARAALTEMRRLLGVLREDAGTPTGRKPQPGLQQLIELIDESRTAGGGTTRLIVSGPVALLDPGVELTAYRIVQEALTNARRHAPGSAVDVELHYREDTLRVRIRDNGPGPPTGPSTSGRGPSGHGLLGMRERAGAVSGDLRTGRAPGGGFLVEARLPTPSSTPSPTPTPGDPA